MSSTLTPRARARREAIAQIKELALAQLAHQGAGELSLRAIARELGMVSSGIYRYFPSRDALLTALIIDAYTDLATAIRESGASASNDQRAFAACAEFRRWALTSPHRFHLIYGTPVPGYAAPTETIEPAGEVFFALVQALGEPAGTSGTPDSPALPPELGALAEQSAAHVGEGISPRRLVRSVELLSQIIGLLHAELGGHLVGTFTPAEPLFDHAVREAIARLDS